MGLMLVYLCLDHERADGGQALSVYSASYALPNVGVELHAASTATSSTLAMVWATPATAPPLQEARPMPLVIEPLLLVRRARGLRQSSPGCPSGEGRQGEPWGP